MRRSTSEKMDSFVTRIRENISKKLQKKVKNKKSKKSENQDCGSSSPETLVPELIFKLNDQIIQLKENELAQDFLMQNGLEMTIFEANFEIEVNPPMVLNVKLPESVMSGYLVYPFKMEFEYANQKDSNFTWCVSEPNLVVTKDSDSALKKTKWTKRHDGFFYMTSNEDIGRFIKLVITPKDGQRSGIEHEIISKQAVSAGMFKTYDILVAEIFS